MRIPQRVRVVEVGPRDGLQNEQVIVPVEARLALVEGLADAGLTSIEVGSFVSPRWVPQMQGTAELLSRLPRRPGVRYPVLVPNLKGLEHALSAGVEEIAVFAAASESFSQRNINCSIADSLDRFAPVVERAQASGMQVRGYVSCVLGCPYEGDVAPDVVADVAGALARMGCYEVSLGDTIGVGTPQRAAQLVDRVAQEVPLDRIAVHFHDTYGQALANVLACLDRGVTAVDSAVAGLGGCPYAPGAAGNLATEALAYMLAGMGVQTGIQLSRLREVGRAIRAVLDRTAGPICC